MRTQLYKIALTAGIAITFTFGCSEDSGGGGGEIEPSSSSVAPSSSSVAPSSSSVAPSSSSVALSSSSVAPSSSSVAPSSSSVVPSSSSVVPSSSSVVPSSSSVVPSSSSVVPSSSSVVPSSSSAVSSYTPANYSNPYRTVTIGTQVWLAENLNYNATASKCYDNDPDNCATYGRLYDWATAMGFDASCNSNNCSSLIQSKHQGICPNGWHLPTQVEWNTLTSFIETDKGCSSCDAKHLKSMSGWYNEGNDLDSYGFAALPGGIGLSDGDFGSVGLLGNLRSATEGSAYGAYCRGMNFFNEYTNWINYDKTSLQSVRCVQD